MEDHHYLSFDFFSYLNIKIVENKDIQRKYLFVILFNDSICLQKLVNEMEMWILL